ncbi:two-component system response regulator [Rhizobium sp. Root73]|uniref:response regulator n=1 Tax=unclassified Rhizobium TaxID=2613769 RepID=UPI00071532E0|nr:MULTISPECIES: response regulator [unclassified Rhizobium]KQV34109.1 two-component system response regulator [Rhizobium sp. Root1204]KQY17594.1 two-component system response regulator [Rhizobium sp. Root1334]KRC13469.1 two-component system response regulator [Rhizobium sp. Root73]
MNDVASFGANIQKTVLEATSDALGLAILVCDKNDEIVFATRPILQFYPIPAHFLEAGTRLKDFLGAIFDSGVRSGTAPESSRRHANREEWISEHLSHHWRERFDVVERIGRHRWINVRTRRLSNGLGIVAINDVSEQKKRDEQMQLDMERVELTEGILDCLPNPLCVKDRNLSYIAVNKAFCDLHGMTPDAILGRSVWDLLEPDLAEKFERSDRVTLESGVIHCQPEQIVKADGEDLWVVTRKFRVGDPGKHLLVTCMNDVTDLVVGYDGLDGITSGRSPLQVKDYSTFAPAQNCYDPFRSIDMQHLVEAGAIIDPDMRGRQKILLMTAAAALEINLVPQLRRWGFDACAVRNATELAAFKDACTARGITIDALLIDGTMAHALATLANWTVSPSLLIAKDWKAVELRASITALCEHGIGALPSVEAEGPADWDIIVPEANLTGRPMPEVEVVVAEDNEINQFVFAQILEGIGISYRIAANGEEAVKLWQQYRPNLVLMDVSMPVMNGFDATRAIRALEKNAVFQTPIIAVTAQALDIDIEQSKLAGMDDYITKPISPDMIEAVYRKFVNAKTERMAG